MVFTGHILAKWRHHAFGMPLYAENGDAGMKNGFDDPIRCAGCRAE